MGSDSMVFAHVSILSKIVIAICTKCVKQFYIWLFMDDQNKSGIYSHLF